MKRMLTLLAALMLLLTAIPASAESLFSLLPTSQTDPIPNYGLMAGVDPTSEETLEDGSTRYHYANVAAQSFLDFGTLLGDKGYAIDPNSMKVEGTAQTMNLVKDDIVFTITYDQVAMTLVVTYPEGANVEQPKIPDPFEGYIELQWGQSVIMRTAHFQGTFTLIQYSTSYTYRHGNTLSYHWSDDAPNILFSIDNVGTDEVRVIDIIDNVEYHYINTDNHYSTESTLRSYVAFDSPTYGVHDIKDTVTIQSLCYAELNHGIRIDNERIVNATDGIAAITFTLCDGNHYVVYLRRPAE